MKIVKLEHGFEIPPLWHFMRENLPPSLLAVKMDNGYGHVFGVEVKADSVANRIPVVRAFTGNVARIWADACELFEPQYFSDFEDVIRKYEARYGKEVEFRYWQSS